MLFCAVNSGRIMENVKVSALWLDFLCAAIGINAAREHDPCPVSLIILYRYGVCAVSVTMPSHCHDLDACVCLCVLCVCVCVCLSVCLS